MRRQDAFLRWLLLASLVGPAILVGFFAWHTYHEALRSAADRADRYAAIVEEHALKVFETIGLTLENVDRRLQGLSPAEIANSKELWEELRRFQERSEQVGAIFVSGSDGRSVLTTRQYPAPEADFSDRDYFQEQRIRDRGLYVGRAYVGKISRDPIFNFSIRKRSADGEFDGILGISAFVSYFQNYYQTLGQPSDNFRITLLRDDGHVLVHQPSINSTVETATDTFLFKLLSQSEGRAFVAPSMIDGTERIFGHHKLRSYPVYALYSIDRSAVVAIWLRGLLPGAALALATALCLFATCLMALQRAKQEQRSMQALQIEMERRERAEASLLQTQRLEAIGELTGGIAHDFNNLLMVISGNLDLAERRSDPGALRRKLQSIRYATDRAKSLTQQLLGFARRNMRDPKTADLNEALKKAETLIQYSLPQNVSLEISLAAEPCPVRFDLSELEAALLNLAGNARDAMPAGGTLSISVRRVSEAGSSQQYELCVRDTGMGMPPEVLRRVYEPFFSTKASGKGTGLGLSQVYGFVQQTGGSIDIASEVGSGTSVTIRFPRSDEPVGELDKPSSLPEGHEGTLTILVVEGDREVRRVSTAMLEDIGHQVLLARNSAEALALLHAGHRIDVLFADVSLDKGISGPELGEQAIGSFPHLKVLLTTGHPGRADLLRRTEFAILAKPYSRIALQAAIEALQTRSAHSALAQNIPA